MNQKIPSELQMKSGLHFQRILKMNLKTNLSNESSFHIFPQNEFVDRPTQKKIWSFKSLTKGWHYGEGVPFTKDLLERAIALNQDALNFGFFETDAFPGISGEIMLVIYHENQDLEFTIETNGQITFVHEIDGEEILYEESLSFEDAKTKMIPSTQIVA